ncbi:MAG: MATE family efflux transporter, partial [Calditrichales bacterium]
KLFNMDVDGVAWGTVVANYTGVLTAVFLYRRRYATPVVYGDLKAIFELTAMKRFFRVGRDIFIRTLVLIFAFSFFTATSAGQGDMVLAANSILINLWTIMAYGIDGFAFAAESLIGRYMGARDRKQLQSAIRHIFAWGLALGILFSAAFSIFPEKILAVFTNKPEVIALALSMMIWTQAAPLISTICYVWDGVYIGATATRAMRNTMIISLAVFYLPVYYLLQPLIPHHALWLALVIFMLARGVTLSIYYKKEILGQLDNTPLPDRVNTL